MHMQPNHITNGHLHKKHMKQYNFFAAGRENYHKNICIHKNIQCLQESMQAF